MFTKFEEIIEDHRKRSRQTIIIALVAFLVLFVLFNVVFATIVIQRGPASKINALLSWNPTPRQYALSLIEMLMLFWWSWLFLNYKLIQMRASLVSEQMINDYKEGRIEQTIKPASWDDFEQSSFHSKRIGSKLLFAMSALLILSTALSWGRQSMPVILCGGLLIYEIIALLKARSIEAFLLGIEQTYSERSSKLLSPASLPQMPKYLILGLSIGILFGIITNLLFHFNRLESVFFFLAFLGLSAAASLLRGTNKLFMQVVKFADSVRLSRNSI